MKNLLIGKKSQMNCCEICYFTCERVTHKLKYEFSIIISYRGEKFLCITPWLSTRRGFYFSSSLHRWLFSVLFNDWLMHSVSVGMCFIIYIYCRTFFRLSKIMNSAIKTILPSYIRREVI